MRQAFLHYAIIHIIFSNLKRFNYFLKQDTVATDRQIEAFLEEILKKLYLLLHLDIYHNMATPCCYYLSLSVFCDMTGIYTSLHLHSLLHVVSIMIQQRLKSHSQLFYKVDTYFSQHFCCNTHIHNFVVVVCNKSCICTFCYLGYLLFEALFV